MKTKELIKLLLEEVSQQNNLLLELSRLPLTELLKRPTEGKWNALECIEHLNSYARHYLSAFEKSMEQSIAKQRKPKEEVKSTWLGRKCISAVNINNSKPIKTPKRHNPINKSLNANVMTEFSNHQIKLKALLDKSVIVDLNSSKVSIELMPILKLNLGEFLPFFIFHQTRHLTQARKAAIGVHNIS